MKYLYRILLAFVLLIGAAWLAKKIQVSQPPSGEPYQVVPNWPRLPEGVRIGQVSGIGINSRGDVIVFHRADRVWGGEDFGLDFISSPTVFVLDDETGELLDSWGEDMFVIPHGLTIDHEDNLWITDVGLHQVLKFDSSGNLLMTLGERGVAGNDNDHFNQPTDVAIAQDGSFYVSDGYGNSRISKFSPSGEFIESWGTFGNESSQFDTPHSIALDPAGNVYVADRGNARLQIFDPNGNFIGEWKSSALGRPWAVRIDSSGNIFIVDGGDQSQFWPDRARILKVDPAGNILASFGSYGSEPGQFIWPHAIALGNDGALYVGEVATGMRIQKFKPAK
ncbi:MAG: hypothetical protein MHPDNHAH_00930 [Anaerolineales bacterium]|nr:hypothetical protein [Anaerolineales bacterium]